MSTSSLRCKKCYVVNPSSLEFCEKCGEPLRKNSQKAPFSSQQGIASLPISSWVTNHLAIFLFVLAILSLVILPTRSKASSAGFIVILFGAGVYPLSNMLKGFGSIFGKRFMRLTGKDQFRTFLFALPLFITSSGIIAFFMVFLAEYEIQLHCSGAGCAQAGMGLFMFIPIAWASYSITQTLCRFFTRRNWWPSELAPSFP